MSYRRTIQIGLVLLVVAKAISLGLLWQGHLWSEPSAAAQDKEEALAAEEDTQKAQKPAGNCEQTANVRRVLDAVSEKDKELSRKERLLAEREAQVNFMEQDVAKKIGELEQIERKLAATLELLEQESKTARESLAKIYSGMKPGEAARILSSLDEDTVMRIFSGMKERNISQILPLVDRELAVALTNRLARNAAASPASKDTGVR